MKILLLSHKFFPDIGGIESISQILADEFVLAGHEVRVITWTVDSTNHQFSYQVIRNPSIRLLFEQSRWADVVLENNPASRLSWPALLLHKPIVVALHTWIAQPDGRVTLLDKLKKMKLRLSKAVIAVSHSIRDATFKEAIVIPNPFKAGLFNNSGIEKRDKEFVFLGRLVSDKGADFAIEAIGKLHKENRKHILTIIGDGPEKAQLFKLAGDLGLMEQIIFKGSLTGDNLVKELSRHRYILIPSKWREPFGVVALEGLACGCIPVVSDGGGLPDAVGEAGLIFERGNLEDMVDKIKSLLDSPEMENRLLRAAPSKIADHQPGVIAKRYLEVLQQFN